MIATFFRATVFVVLSIVATRAAAKQITLDEFSGHETLVSFGPPEFGLSSGFSYAGMTVSVRDNFFLYGNVDLSGFFDNIPGASLGTAMRTTAAATFPTYLRFEFDTPIRRFGLLMSSGTVAGWTISAVDDDFNVLASATGVMPDNSAAVFAGLESSQSFTRLELYETQRNGQNDGFDDIRFESVAEPTSCALFTIALIAFFAARKSSLSVKRTTSLQ